jgi:hypothetical protein
VLGLERGRQRGPAHVDPGPPFRPHLDQFFGHPGDLTDRPLTPGCRGVGV